MDNVEIDDNMDRVINEINNRDKLDKERKEKRLQKDIENEEKKIQNRQYKLSNKDKAKIMRIGVRIEREVSELKAGMLVPTNKGTSKLLKEKVLVYRRSKLINVIYYLNDSDDNI